MVRLCDGLPAALHVAGRWVRTHRLRPLSRILADLQTELDEKGVSGVDHIWDTVYERAPATTAEAATSGTATNG